MEIIAIIIGLIAILRLSYSNGNKQANDLMVKLGGESESIQKWANHSMILDLLLLGLLPLIFLVYSLSWWGLLYVPIAFLVTAKLSVIYLKKQLQVRLSQKQQSLDSASRKWKATKNSDDEIGFDIKQNEVNQLLWLISHPHSAQHFALSDDSNINSSIVASFESQVETLNNISKQEKNTQED